MAITPRAVTAGGAMAERKVMKLSCRADCVPAKVSQRVISCAVPFEKLIHRLSQKIGERAIMIWQSGTNTGFCKNRISLLKIMVFTGLVYVVCCRITAFTGSIND